MGIQQLRHIMVLRVKLLCEYSMFGVFSRMGASMGISTARVRKFFIYCTFLTFGSPVFFYLATAFVLSLGRYAREHQRKPIWDF